MKKVPKSSNTFSCRTCNYTTGRESQYKRHLMTAKHKIQQNTIQIQQHDKTYTCGCGNVYTHRGSLYNHKKKCSYMNLKSSEFNNDIKVIQKSVQYDDNIFEKQAEKSVIEPESDYKNMFIELIKQNQDFKSLIVEQTKQLNEQQKENQTLQKQLIDVVKDGKTINNMTNSNNNNQNFNLNFFLNNTCKDAMNMSEFIENLDVNFNDIEYIGRNGYVNGMTNMILSRIKDLDVTKRPLHCTDLKRETMYIKDNDEWSKDTPDNTQLRNMVKIVAKHNQYQFPLWREKHPASDDMNSETFEFSLKMIQNILGDVGEEHIKLDNKVMRNLSKHILVDKNI